MAILKYSFALVIIFLLRKILIEKYPMLRKPQPLKDKQSAKYLFSGWIIGIIYIAV
jgi:hypothetical protein